MNWHAIRHGCIVFEFLATIGVFAAVGALMAWHARLITKGETCIESNINKRERERLGREGRLFRNPYNHGAKTNWKIFLGLTQPGKTWRHVLLPSTHLPQGDGVHWREFMKSHSNYN